MGKNSILILSSTLGAGHQSASQAIAQIIRTQWPKAEINIVDTSPPLGSAVYRFLSNYLTDIFIENWHNFNTESAAKLLLLLYTPVALTKITPLIKRYRPSLIIATHAFSSKAVEIALKNLGLHAPMVIVLVDPFSIHHAWTVYKDADQYWLPNQQAKKLFIRRGVDRNRLLITGHPIRTITPDLTNTHITKLRRAQNLDPYKLTFFLGGSGEGVGRVDKIVQQLLTRPALLKSVQFIICCGKNQLLFQQMRLLEFKFPKLIFAYGFTEKIYELIMMSDVVVGKAGPNLMFEAIALGKPLLTTGLPLGQEAGNYRYIKKSGLGFVTYSPRQTVKKIISIIKTPSIINQFLPAIKKRQRLIMQTPRLIIGALRQYL